MKATTGQTYWVTVDSGSIHYAAYGKLVSKGVRFRGVVYWAFYGQAMIFLVDEDDIVALDHAKGVY